MHEPHLFSAMTGFILYNFPHAFNAHCAEAIDVFRVKKKTSKHLYSHVLIPVVGNLFVPVKTEGQKVTWTKTNVGHLIQYKMCGSLMGK